MRCVTTPLPSSDIERTRAHALLSGQTTTLVSFICKHWGQPLLAESVRVSQLRLADKQARIRLDAMQLRQHTRGFTVLDLQHISVENGDITITQQKHDYIVPDCADLTFVLANASQDLQSREKDVITVFIEQSMQDAVAMHEVIVAANQETIDTAMLMFAGFFCMQSLLPPQHTPTEVCADAALTRPPPHHHNLFARRARWGQPYISQTYPLRKFQSSFAYVWFGGMSQGDGVTHNGS